jgi:hypothetical protein
VRHRRGSGTLRLVVLLAAMATAAGHACAEPEPGEGVGATSAALAMTSPELGSAADHHADCETPSGASVGAPAVLLARAQAPGVAIPPASADHPPSVPVPVLRPPRFLLHAALLN